MRQQTYLNVILTVNAVLLSGVVWTQVSDRPLLAEQAQAQPDRGFPNPSQQRREMIEVLNAINANLAKQHELLSSGKLQVEVTSLPEVEDDQSADAGPLPPGVVRGGGEEQP